MLLLEKNEADRVGESNGPPRFDNLQTLRSGIIVVKQRFGTWLDGIWAGRSFVLSQPASFLLLCKRTVRLLTDDRLVRFSLTPVTPDVGFKAKLANGRNDDGKPISLCRKLDSHAWHRSVATNYVD